MGSAESFRVSVCRAGKFARPQASNSNGSQRTGHSVWIASHPLRSIGCGEPLAWVSATPTPMQLLNGPAQKRPDLTLLPTDQPRAMEGIPTPGVNRLRLLAGHRNRMATR